MPSKHKKIVEKCFEAEILRPYKNDPSLVDISKVPDSIDAKNAVLQIKQLFCLEFKYEMAEYMRKHIDLGIMDFIWNFYDNRDSTYAIISKEDVEKVYIKFYDDLAKQS
uniref:Uncharacterized protein n=1 Tax=Panagrolaimus superbus TaxID=310955 RepID=A0A914Y7T0_9BILA